MPRAFGFGEDAPDATLRPLPLFAAAAGHSAHEAEPRACVSRKLFGDSLRIAREYSMSL